MKKMMITLGAASVLSALLLSACAGAAPARDETPGFGNAEGKEWLLSEIRAGDKTVRVDRAELAGDNMAGFYTINFGGSELSGMGAPNRYTGPYTSGAGRSLTIGNLASTRMAAFREPDGLRETEYFNYLSKVSRWNLENDLLELYSENPDGAEAVLVFTVK